MLNSTHTVDPALLTSFQENSLRINVGPRDIKKHMEQIWTQSDPVKPVSVQSRSVESMCEQKSVPIAVVTTIV